jgi:Niemann-Pick C1 protein
MSTMGTSVFVGIACTKFIGVAVLGLAPSTLFKLYYFRMYILMVILGVFNVNYLYSNLGTYFITHILRFGWTRV